MARGPLRDVVDAPLFIVPRVLESLHGYRAAPKLAQLANDEERSRLAAALDALGDRLLADIERHPTTFWVMKQCQPALELAQGASREARQQFRAELEPLLVLLGIRDANDVLYFYLSA